MITRTFIDKTGWPKGPWLTEPDQVMWVNEDTQYRCTMRRNLLGAWCGFVGLTPEHTLYMIPYSDSVFNFVDVHGDVAFSGFKDAESIAFSPPIKTWWIGFDAMQDADLCPAANVVIPATKKKRRKSLSELSQEYRDWEYIYNEVNFLATQLFTFDENYDD